MNIDSANLEHYVGLTLLSLGTVATILLGIGWALSRGDKS